LFGKIPLRIYLDTSDYSCFADIGYRNEPGLDDILNFLREKKEQGLIEVRFSAIHLFEFLKDPSQRALALRKVQIMEELCGDRAFRFFTDVLEQEREALRLGADPASLVISDEGDWFPSTESDDSFKLDTIFPGLLERFPMFGAEQLRAMLKSPEAAAFLKQNMPKELPLANVYGSDFLDRFLSGVSGQEITREAIRGFVKPSIFIEHYLEGQPAAQRFFGGLARLEQQLHGTLVQVQEKLKPHVEFLLGLDPDIVKRTRQFVKRLGMSGSSASYLELEKLPKHLQEAVGQDRFLKEVPALSTHFNVLAAYMRDIIYPSPVLPEIKESDAGDILHATYLPYVDLYRTDGRFGALMNSVPKPSTVKVIPKLRQLPEAIEKALA
jgi:hypothetical protein